jgi:hypothetical protein
MALLQLLGEEEIGEDPVHGYFDDLYRVVCISERPASRGRAAGVVRSTYIVDWEQLVHLLEDYACFGEDIVEVARISGDEAELVRRSPGSVYRIARA